MTVDTAMAIDVVFFASMALGLLFNAWLFWQNMKIETTLNRRESDLMSRERIAAQNALELDLAARNSPNVVFLPPRHDAKA
jgi:hypothetical protein